MRKLDVHEFALMFPTASGPDFNSLKDDIRRHGVKVPVVLFEGKILDGRSRYHAALYLGVEIPTVTFEGDARSALELAASYNLHRRHLTPSQKAVVAVDIAKRLQRINGTPMPEAKIQAAAMVSAAKSSVDRAERICRNHPARHQELRNGTATIGEIENAEYGRARRRLCCPKCKHEWHVDW